MSKTTPATITERQPVPEDPAEQARWDHTGLRARMLDGEWREDAQSHYGGFFHRSVRSLLPDSDIAMNPFLSLSLQQATAYDDEPIVRVDPAVADGAESASDETMLAGIITADCWPLMTDGLVRIVGLHELVVYITWRGGSIAYELIDPHFMTGVGSPDNPDQLARCTRLRSRTVPGSSPPKREWTWETWDPSWNEGEGLFKIEAERPTGTVLSRIASAIGFELTRLVDVTLEYQPDFDGIYPRKNRWGDNLMPFVVFHDRMGSRLWRPYPGIEVVHGTMTTSALNSMWVLGFRDVSNRLRWVLNARPLGLRTAPPEEGKADGYVPIQPGTVMQFESLSADRPASIGEWSAAMDPKASREAVDGFVREFAIYAGVSPADLKVTSGQSGYAIALTRDGQRKSQKRVVPSLVRADKLRLATAAAIRNAAVEANENPENPEAYVITYEGIAPTAEEMRAEREEADAQRAAGVISPVEHYQRHHPEASDDDAWTALKDAALQERELEALRSGPPMAVQPPPSEPPTEPPRENDDA